MSDTARLLKVQGAYYLVTGIWPLVSMRAFEKVTGEKTDRWLVQMVGLLAASVGASLYLAADRKPVEPATVVLSIATAAAFAGIDVVHVARRRISPIYLADAVAETLMVALLFRAKGR